VTTRTLPFDLVGAVKQLQQAVQALQTQQSFHFSVPTESGFSTVVATGVAQNPLTGEVLDDPPTYGVTAYDPTTGERTAQFGSLPDGNYGVGVWEPGGTYVELSTLGFGLQVADTPAAMTFTGGGSTWQDALDGDGPTVTATVGTSGRALVVMYADVSLDSGDAEGQVGAVGLQIDGVGPDSNGTVPAGVGTTSTSNVAASVSKANLVTGLSPGSHEFTMQYLTIEDFAVVFEYRVLTVQPF